MLANLVWLLCVLQVVAAQKFFECKELMKDVSSDHVALGMVKKGMNDKLKFSSACLELLLKKNFMETSEYLLNEYYPTTSIDTEIIVRSVANDIQRNQDYVIFKLKQKMMEGVQFPTLQPVIAKPFATPLTVIVLSIIPSIAPKLVCPPEKLICS